MKKTKYLLGAIVLVLLVTPFVPLIIQPTGTNIASNELMAIHGSTITIHNNGDFAGLASSGDGSSATPWVIENLILNGNGSGRIFDIDGTTDHFIIRNCYLHNTTSTAIKIYQAGNGTILNNTITDCNTAIEIEDADKHQVINNTITLNNNNGIETNSGALYIDIINNTITHNGGYGIYLWGTNHSLITENTVINSTNDGFVFDDTCTNNTVSYNTFNNNTNGFYIVDTCEDNKIQHNTINDNLGYGIYIGSGFCNYNTFLNNTVKDGGNSGVYSDEAAHNIFTLNTVCENDGYGFDVGSNNDNYTFTNNNASDNTASGFYLECGNNTLTYNQANNNTDHGIHLNSADENSLILNTANGNGIYGVYVQDCEDTNVTWNVLHENPTSVIQSGGSGNIVTNNSAVAATLTGASFTPATGGTGTTFNFSVIYTDADNLAPFNMRVFIDGTPHDMVKNNTGDNDYTDGCTYVYTTTLALGAHTFYFDAFDITHQVTTTQAAGPTVSPPGSTTPIPGFGFLMLLISLLGLSLAYFVIKKRNLPEII